MNDCSCGAVRRKFWIWMDDNDTLHASNFEPSNGSIRAVYAATARDALLPIVERRAPKHQVHEADNPAAGWEGRCSAQLAAAAS